MKKVNYNSKAGEDIYTGDIIRTGCCGHQKYYLVKETENGVSPFVDFDVKDGDFVRIGKYEDIPNADEKLQNINPSKVCE